VCQEVAFNRHTQPHIDGAELGKLGNYLHGILKIKASGLPTIKSDALRFKKEREQLTQHVLSRKRVWILTTMAMRLPTLLESNTHKRNWVVIFDEAGAMKDYEVMMPIMTYNPERVVLVGDPEQLSATLLSDAGRRAWSNSILKRQLDAGCVQVTLSRNHRTHDQAGLHTSDLFYQGRMDLAVRTVNPR
jgi:superfamily I DNA and/or RNA helicase